MYMSGVGDMLSDHHHIDSMCVSNLLTLPSQMMPHQKKDRTKCSVPWDAGWLITDKIKLFRNMSFLRKVYHGRFNEIVKVKLWVNEKPT